MDRSYQLIVSDATGTALSVQDYRCAFMVEKSMINNPNTCQVSLYNLPEDMQNFTYGNNAKLSLWVDSDQGTAGTVFSGELYHAYRGKEKGTRVLTLRAFDGDRYLRYATVNQSVAAGMGAEELLRLCTLGASIPIGLGYVSQDLSSVRLARGRVLHGKAIDAVRVLARGQNAQYFVEDGLLCFLRASDAASNDPIELTAQNGLRNTPILMPDGAFAESVMRPELKLASLVRINTTQSSGALGRDSLYRLTRILHIGDTQEKPWETQLWGLEQAGSHLSMLEKTIDPWRG